MIITKKLFFIAILGLGMQLCASEKTSDVKLLDFATSLDKIPKNEPKNIADWIRKTFWSRDEHNKQITDNLEKIINSDEPLTTKTQSIKEIWQRETTPQNEGYFTNISTFAKAAAAAIITAGIISYFYFMRPWGTSNTQ